MGLLNNLFKPPDDNSAQPRATKVIDLATTGPPALQTKPQPSATTTAARRQPRPQRRDIENLTVDWRGDNRKRLQLIDRIHSDIDDRTTETSYNRLQGDIDFECRPAELTKKDIADFQRLRLKIRVGVAMKKAWSEGIGSGKLSQQMNGVRHFSKRNIEKYYKVIYQNFYAEYSDY